MYTWAMYWRRLYLNRTVYIIPTARRHTTTRGHYKCIQLWRHTPRGVLTQGSRERSRLNETGTSKFYVNYTFMLQRFQTFGNVFAVPLSHCESFSFISLWKSKIMSKASLVYDFICFLLIVIVMRYNQYGFSKDYYFPAILDV